VLLDGPSTSMQLSGALLVVTSTNAVTNLGSVLTIDTVTGVTRTIASGRSLPINPTIGMKDAYWMEWEPSAADGQFRPIVKAPLDEPGDVSTVLRTNGSGYQMLGLGTLYFQNGLDEIDSLQPGAASATPLVTGSSALFFAADDQYLYWTDCSRSEVARVPFGGGQPQHLADGSCPYSIGLLGFDLLYMNAGEPGVHRIPAAGGPGTVIGTSNIVSNTNLAVSPGWTTDEQAAYFGAAEGLYRVMLSTGEIARLATGLVYDVAVDASCVYWTDSDAAAVFMLPK